MWKSVVGYEGLYEVSDAGEVRRLPVKWSPKGGPVKQHEDKRGYLRVTLSKDSKITTYSVHRLVMTAFVGPRVGDMTINHMDLDKKNNKLANLEFCTRLENTQHAVAHGRISLGQAVLTEAQVREIRSSYVWHQNSRQLAEKFGVTQRTIVRTARGDNWGHLSQVPT